MLLVLLMQGGSSSKDRQLMLDKIAFMAGVGDHENIVKFIASCNDSDEGIQCLHRHPSVDQGGDTCPLWKRQNVVLYRNILYLC